MTSMALRQLGGAIWRWLDVGPSRLVLVLAASAILTSCTSGNQAGPPTLANILTPSQSEQNNAATADTSNQIQHLATPAEQKQISTRPAGVPKVRPGSTELAPAIQNALAPIQQPEQPAQQAATELATEQPKKPEPVLTLFERLRAPRNTSPDINRTGATPRPTAPAKPKAQATASNLQNDVPSIALAESENKPVKRQSTSLFANLFQNNAASSANGSTNTVRSGVVRTRTSKNRARLRWNTSALPGVRKKNDIFGIGVDEGHGIDEGVRLASVTNRARRGAHGLLLQRKDVQVHCFPPQLVRLLKQVERRFGRKPIVTSGYRSKRHNRMIRGARNSMHIRCMAADIQLKGVSKRSLARYLRSLPGRGGVGTYCHTRSVHIDIGRKRDWNRRCRRSRKRKS